RAEADLFSRGEELEDRNDSVSDELPEWRRSRSHRPSTQRPRARSHVRSVREADLGPDLELGATNAKRPGHLSLLDANEAFDLDLVGDDHAEAEELATANHELLPEGLDDLVRALRMRS